MPKLRITEDLKKLISEYKQKRRQFKTRLEEFGHLQSAGDKEIFQELCFCILTPQSKAVNCARVIEELARTGLLFKGNVAILKKKMKGFVRFHNKKAEYLICARDFFTNKKAIDIKSRIDTSDNLKAREWLVKNIKGVGYKETSHFLRNIGLGKGLAILDVHILKNLKRYGIIEKVPQSITRKAYLETEERMKAFSRKINIPLEEMDLLFWSKETGFVFK